MAEMLKVEVCYALPDKQFLVPVVLAEGATLQRAIEASGLLEKHPEIDLQETFAVHWIRVSVAKLGMMPGVKRVGVIIERSM